MDMGLSLCKRKKESSPLPKEEVVGKRSRRRRRRHANTEYYIPDDLLYSNILPLLPFKSLARFRSVSKNWLAMIDDDDDFCRNQSCSPSPISTAYICISRTGLEFLPFSPSLSLGVPDPSLSFIPEKELGNVELVASTNGLLCLSVGVDSLSVFNPATRQGDIIPPDYDSNIMGLAFDPSRDSCYTLVNVVIEESMYIFNVFTSDTGEWIESESEVSWLPTHCLPKKSVYAGSGVLYWDCGSHLLWFDVAKDVAGSRAIPGFDRQDRGRQAIGVSKEGQVTIARARKKGLDVWILVGGSRWEKLHEKSWEEISWRWLIYWELVVRPLPFDGGEKIYLGLKKKKRRMSRSRWENVMKVVYYNMRTGEVVDEGKELRINEFDDNIFTYHNSMVDMPIIPWWIHQIYSDVLQIAGNS